MSTVGQSPPLRLSVPPGALVRWPDDFGTRFTIFVDTEEEFDWSAPFSRTARSVAAIDALPEAHRRFAERGTGLVYMIDHPIATDPRAIDILSLAIGDGRSAIGTQLHPWVNPPHDETPSIRNSFAGNLPRALEAAKLDVLTDAITAAFGVRPLAYRAGRYGIGANSFALLAERGYLIDTSMRARHDYSPEGGPDFARIGDAAFRVGPGEAIVELPFTTVFTGRARCWAPALYGAFGRVPRGHGMLARTGLVSRVSLTPEGISVAEALEAIRIALGEGVRLLNFAFHSPSLVPGNTPYVRDAGDLRRFHGWWDHVLDLLDRRGVRPATLTQVIAAAR